MNHRFVGCSLKSPGSTKYIRLNVETREVELDDRSIILPEDAFQVLRMLVEDHPRVLTRTALMMALWGGASTDRIPQLEEQVSALQKMVGDTVRIEIVTGIGYRLF